MDRQTIVRTAVSALAAGAVATAAKTKAEEILQPATEKLLPPTAAEKTEIGADPAGHPENMPPSEFADRAQHALTGRALTDEQRAKVSQPLHWATGLGFAVGYAFAAMRFPRVRAGHGTIAATGLFVGAHVIGLPAAGVQHPPTRLPRAWWGWEGGSHLVYGVVLDSTLRILGRRRG